jgi:hypothetical protein
MSPEIVGMLAAIGCTIFYLMGRFHNEERLRSKLYIIKQERDILEESYKAAMQEVVSHRIKTGSPLAETVGRVRPKQRGEAA